MKLNYFSSQTLPKGNFGNRNGNPSISMGKNGAIRFNHAASELIGIEHGSKVSIAQDEEAPENWYVFVDKDNGFECRLMSDKKSHGFNHSALIQMFRDAMGIAEGKGITYRIAGQPTTFKRDKKPYWGILFTA